MNTGGGKRLVYNVRAFPLNLDSHFFIFVKEFLHVMIFTSGYIFHGLFATFVESLLTCVLFVIIMNIENKCMTHEQ